jgi:hypothetical protein
MQEKSTNKALLVYKAHQKQPSINHLAVTDKTDNRVTDLLNTQPYQRNQQHNIKINKKTTIFIHLFTFTAKLSSQKPLKSLSCTEKTTVPPFLTTSSLSAKRLYTRTLYNSVASATVPCFVQGWVVLLDGLYFW